MWRPISMSPPNKNQSSSSSSHPLCQGISKLQALSRHSCCQFSTHISCCHMHSCPARPIASETWRKEAKKNQILTRAWKNTSSCHICLISGGLLATFLDLFFPTKLSLKGVSYTGNIPHQISPAQWMQYFSVLINSVPQSPKQHPNLLIPLMVTQFRPNQFRPA